MKKIEIEKLEKEYEIITDVVELIKKIQVILKSGDVKLHMLFKALVNFEQLSISEE